MMTTFLVAFKIAVCLFPFIALLCSSVLFYRLYKKGKRLTVWQGIIFYSFIFYCLVMFCLVVFPLPNRDVVAELQTPWIQLRLFSFINDFQRETVLNLHDSQSYLPALTQNVVLQPLLNIIMFFPLGVYYAYAFRKKFSTTIITAFCISLFFEFTQLTGIYGIYSRRYRLFDVDDLLLNTLGAVLGFCLTAFIMNVFMKQKVKKTPHIVKKDVSILNY